MVGAQALATATAAAAAGGPGSLAGSLAQRPLAAIGLSPEEGKISGTRARPGTTARTRTRTTDDGRRHALHTHARTQTRRVGRHRYSATREEDGREEQTEEQAGPGRRRRRGDTDRDRHLKRFISPTTDHPDSTLTTIPLLAPTGYTPHANDTHTHPADPTTNHPPLNTTRLSHESAPLLPASSTCILAR